MIEHTGPQKKQAILCVDDEAIILMYLGSILERHYGDRFVIEKAPNAEKALLILDSFISAGISNVLIVTDWRLPGMVGSDFIQLASQKYPQLKALLVSGMQFDQCAVKGFIPPGFHGFLTKPILGETLYRAVDQLIAMDQELVLDQSSSQG